MTKNREDKVTQDRRDFLKMASLGTAAGGIALASSTVAQAEALEPQEGSGYRETAHVKKYYELAKF